MYIVAHVEHYLDIYVHFISRHLCKPAKRLCDIEIKYIYLWSPEFRM